MVWTRPESGPRIFSYWLKAVSDIDKLRILILQLIHSLFHHAVSKITHQQESNFKRVGRSGKKRHQQTVLLYLCKNCLYRNTYGPLQKNLRFLKLSMWRGFDYLFVFLFCSYIFSLHYGKYSKCNLNDLWLVWNIFINWLKARD